MLEKTYGILLETKKSYYLGVVTAKNPDGVIQKFNKAIKEDCVHCLDQQEAYEIDIAMGNKADRQDFTPSIISSSITRLKDTPNEWKPTVTRWRPKEHVSERELSVGNFI